MLAVFGLGLQEVLLLLVMAGVALAGVTVAVVLYVTLGRKRHDEPGND